MNQAFGCGVLAFLCLAAGSGCGGTYRKLKKKFDPTASVGGVTILETTPEHMRIRVDVVTKDADLLMGFLKLRYNFVLEQASTIQNDNLKRAELAELKDSGLSFVVTIPLAKSISADNTLRYSIQGSIVVKVIAELAEIPFSLASSIPLK